MNHRNSPPIKNPAPHRGFNAKAREVLLDSPYVYSGGMMRSGSDEEFLKKVGLIRFRRTGSEELESGGQQESGASTPAGEEENAQTKGENGFDTLDGMPKLMSTNRKSLKAGHRLLADIGKTRSVGDLSKAISAVSNQTKTFAKLDIGRPFSIIEKEKETDEQFDASKRTAQYKVQ